MTVKKGKDTLSVTSFISNKGKVADAPMGASVSTAELVNGSVLLDGSVLADPVSGICKVQKYAKVEAGSTTTSIKVKTAGNQFKVGDFIGSKTSGIAYAITAISSDAGTGLDTITVGTAIDDPDGGYIYQMLAEAATNTSALKYSSLYAITGTNKLVDTTTNLNVDAWVIAAVKKDVIGQELLDALLSNNKYIAEV